jgi:hypothetical protein
VTIYRIKNWSEYQHYKDRCPPWIKLHHAMLTSEIWVMGNDATRALIIASMLLASRNEKQDGSFNGDPEYVKRFAYLNTSPNFKPLIDYNFIELLQDDSAVLADCDTEKRREEAEKEKEKRQSRLRASALPENFAPTDSHFELASKEGVNLHAELEKFTDYHKAKGSAMKDWNAALRTWIRNAAIFAKKNTPLVSRDDKSKAAADFLTGRSKQNAISA